MPSQPTADLFQRRLLVLTGKGGVGKTALCAALGLALARSGRRVLLAEVRAPRRIPPLFGRPVESDGPLALAERLLWINLVPQTALEIYAMRLLRLRTVYRAVFEQRTIRRFLRAMPALAEILVLGHLEDLLTGGDFDAAVLDAPSSGPGALMLRTPFAIMESAPPGPLREGAALVQRLLTDPVSTAVLPVVLAEELPVSEAIGLVHHLRNELHLPLGPVLANRLLADPFPPRSDELLRRFPPDTSGARPLLEAVALYRSRLQLQRRHLDRLRAGVPLPVIELPEVERTPFGPEAIGLLAETLSAATGGRR